MIQLRLASLVLFALALCSCGVLKNSPDEEQSQKYSSKKPKVTESLTPEELARTCMVDVPAESDDATKAAFLESMRGVWVRYPLNSNEPFTRIELHFKPADATVALTTYKEFGKDVENLKWTKVCLSQPLGADHQDYAGLRVLETIAENGGGAAALVRFDGAKLIMSARYYVRNVGSSRMPLGELLGKDEINDLWVFPEHHY